MAQADPRRSVLILAGLGAATGFVTVLIQPFGGIVAEPIRDLLDGFAKDVWETVATFGPGFVFGFVIGWWIHRRHRRSVLAWLAFTVFGTVSWFLAIKLAIKVDGLFKFGEASYALPGLAGGAVGGAIVVTAAGVLYPACRGIGLAVLTVGVCTALGALLHVEKIILFLVWQTALAGLLGLAFASSRGS